METGNRKVGVEIVYMYEKYSKTTKQMAYIWTKDVNISATKMPCRGEHGHSVHRLDVNGYFFITHSGENTFFSLASQGYSDHYGALFCILAAYIDVCVVLMGLGQGV